MNVLYLYESTQTYTNAVHEHLSSFSRYSKYSVYYCHQGADSDFNLDLSVFDAVCIHYSIRLPFDQISPSTCKALQNFNGLKFLFIQDEYDYTHRAWYWIRVLGIGLVFTVVPEREIFRIYPPQEFPNTRFVSVLTGYVPETLLTSENLPPPSKRSIVVGYRGRPLPIRYGKLGREKIEIGRLVKAYCDRHHTRNDIAWSEKGRIYGARWYEFMTSCRSMLGSESGSNVFDWDGSLEKQIAQYRVWRKWASDERVYDLFVRQKEMDGVMNQVSPRIFEAIAAKTVLVLFEGGYSGVVRAGDHYIPVKNDGSNLREVMRLLEDGPYVDSMADRAYRDIIVSGQYSYHAFVELVDLAIGRGVCDTEKKNNAPMMIRKVSAHELAPSITLQPIRAEPPPPMNVKAWGKQKLFELWGRVPEANRAVLRPHLKKLLKRG